MASLRRTLAYKNSCTTYLKAYRSDQDLLHKDFRRRRRKDRVNVEPIKRFPQPVCGGSCERIESNSKKWLLTVGVHCTQRIPLTYEQPLMRSRLPFLYFSTIQQALLLLLEINKGLC